MGGCLVANGWYMLCRRFYCLLARGSWSCQLRARWRRWRPSQGCGPLRHQPAGSPMPRRGSWCHPTGRNRTSTCRQLGTLHVDGLGRGRPGTLDRAEHRQAEGGLRVRVDPARGDDLVSHREERVVPAGHLLARRDLRLLDCILEEGAEEDGAGDSNGAEGGKGSRDPKELVWFMIARTLIFHYVSSKMVETKHISHKTPQLPHLKDLQNIYIQSLAKSAPLAYLAHGPFMHLTIHTVCPRTHLCTR